MISICDSAGVKRLYVAYAKSSSGVNRDTLSICLIIII